MNDNLDLQNIIDRHYDNIYNLINVVNDSSNLINRMLTQNNNNRRNTQQFYNRNQNNINQNTRFTYYPRRQNRSNFMNTPTTMNDHFVNNTTYTFNDNNMQPTNNTQHDNNFVLRFDTLIPFLFDNMTNNTTTNDLSYNIGYITEENKDDISNISCSYELLDIDNYEYIQNPANDICPITRERFNNNQNVMMITSCKHIFNKSSLNRWIINNNTCPTCRSEIIQNLNN